MNGKRSNRITIIGKTGQGKSTLSRALILQAQQREEVILIFDFIGEYSGQVFKDRNEIKLDSPGPFVYRGSDSRYFADTVWQLGRTGKKITCVLDEVDVWGKNSYPLAFLYRYGRHRNINFIAIARRFYDLPVFIRALTSTFAVFQITDERDTGYLARVCGKIISEKVKTLRQFEYINIAL